jgi:uncharacterized membrane protein
MKVNFLIIIQSVLAVIGFITAHIALQAHYGKTDTAFCELGTAFSCDAVNQSVYSVFYGIPFALIGMIGFVLMLATLIAVYKTKKDEFKLALLSLTIIGFGIQLYLTFIEAFVLRMWCLLCLISQTVILLALITAILIYKNKE